MLPHTTTCSVRREARKAIVSPSVVERTKMGPNAVTTEVGAVRSFTVPGAGELCYHDFLGDGPAVLFLHGLGAAGSEAFPGFVRYPFLASRRVLVPDLLGFGYSDRPEHFAYTLEEHTDSVAGLLDHLGISSAHVVGHSMGGSVGILLASRRPDLVAALVVAEAGLDHTPGRASALVMEWSEEAYIREGHATLMNDLADRLRGNAAYGAHVRAVRGAAPHAVHRCVQSGLQVRTPSFADILKALSIPRAYLVGSRSLPAGVTTVPEYVDGVAMAVVPEAGHAMYVDNPDAFMLAVEVALRPQQNKA
jgi:pimeloyl-ACP methyl ester carboxylesterase